MQHLKILRYFSNITYILDVKLNILYVFLNDRNNIYKCIINDNVKLLVSNNYFYLLSPIKHILNTTFIDFRKLHYIKYLIYSLKIEIIGIGYRFSIQKNYIYIYIGYSHLIKISLSNNIQIKYDNREIIIFHKIKYMLGNIYFLLKKLKKDDVYKGKGIKKVYNILNLKIGKSRISKNR